PRICKRERNPNLTRKQRNSSYCNYSLPLKAMEPPKIRIAIVDDHALLRNGVAALMREFEELQVLFEADNAKQFQEKIKQHPLPDVVLMDINMPVMDGYATTGWLKTNYPTVKVLALSMFGDDKAVINMIRNGACG